VIRFQISCGSCYMCDQQLFTQCETTQVRGKGMGAALFGYSELYGQVPGGQAELLRVPQAQFTHIKARRARRTHGLSTFPTSCRRPGRRSPTRIFPTAAR
jgi:threonine dehydrogenase-like Zn-dependent dehydrogenase